LVAGAALAAYPHQYRKCSGINLLRILAVDPGEKRIGLALSDPSATIAGPLQVLQHVSRPVDAAVIAQIAAEHEVDRIIVGQVLDLEGKPNVSGRRAARLAAAIRTQTETPVVLWNEDFSTQDARTARIELGSKRTKRSGHLDELAATVILQSYLDSLPKDE
jgi:putative holliday junction resolvase